MTGNNLSHVRSAHFLDVAFLGEDGFDGAQGVNRAGEI
jgi:hypothetical protein